MKHRYVAALAAIAVVAAVLVYAAAEHGEHTAVRPDQLEWRDGPPSLPAGAQFVILEGDPSQEGFFSLRIKAPDGYRIPPHTHPRVERVTVLEGTFRLGMGREWTDDALQSLPAGSFFQMPPGMPHFAQTEGETVVQLNSQGPWEINYLNPADDPRRE